MNPEVIKLYDSPGFKIQFIHIILFLTCVAWSDLHIYCIEWFNPGISTYIAGLLTNTKFREKINMHNIYLHCYDNNATASIKTPFGN